MVLSIKNLRIATRESRLAVWQAEFVQKKLKSIFPHLNVELHKMTTKGDQILDKTLSKIGGKGLFIKELESSLLSGVTDLAVHSLKDVPVELNDEFEIACILERENPMDAFVSNEYKTFKDLPEGVIVGTSSLRRESQIRAKFPHLVVKPLRGNLDTRLKKLDDGQYSAIILAAAGLKRLNMMDRIKSFVSIDDSLPAVGQGALAIEILKDKFALKEMLSYLHHEETFKCVSAERIVSQYLGGSCQVPLAAHACVINDLFQVRALVASPDGSRILRAESFGSPDEYESVATTVALNLIDQGAREIINASLGIDE
ncbi:hydroxymethylbilane synthase [Taylorella equigenitalis]|uniref:hydroxymethylbilane synthase n=1 Tax=Taylorella equigenitalis TaxID=29575 RepID=UPI0003F80400|nr:hydroxymethylbilane synthase [Taylorella equigenitalis]ASY30637.1 hydroxymethylbilane synthase [Taylorella equigenitalis]KOS58249.1 porphobilinogen deaminase [Taylorella equigenitalis]